MRMVLLLSGLLISGCSSHDLSELLLEAASNSEIGYSGQCANIRQACSIQTDPTSHSDYHEWRDENGDVVCSCG